MRMGLKSGMESTTKEQETGRLQHYEIEPNKLERAWRDSPIETCSSVVALQFCLGCCTEVFRWSVFQKTGEIVLQKVR